MTKHILHCNRLTNKGEKDTDTFCFKEGQYLDIYIYIYNVHTHICTNTHTHGDCPEPGPG